MEHIKELYKSHQKIAFPPMPDEEILCDMVGMDSTLAGRIYVFIHHHGFLDEETFESFKLELKELEELILFLKDESLDYFLKWKTITVLALRYIKEKHRVIPNDVAEKASYFWLTHYRRLQKILNKWNPLNIEELKFGDYDMLNNQVYTTYLRNKSKVKVKGCISKFLKEHNGIERCPPNSIVEEIVKAIS